MITALNVKIYKKINTNGGDSFFNFYIDNYDYLDMKEFLDFVADLNDGDEVNIPNIYAIKDDQRIKEYEVVMTFLNKENDKNYIVFTDNIVDSQGKIRFFGAIYDIDNPNLFVGNLTSKEEWNMLYQLVSNVFKTDV